MFRLFLLVLVSLLGHTSAMAQAKEYTLKGYIAVQGGESFSYRLVFTDSAGNIKGYSLTYLTEGRDVKAWISGTIDRKNKMLSFRENSIIHNNGFESNAIMCLVDAQLTYIPANKGNVLQGPITSKDLSNADCSKGSVNFINDDVLKELFSNAPPAVAATVAPPATAAPKPVVKKPVVVIYDTAPRRPAVIAPPPDKITNNTDKTYDWYSDTVVIDIWDGSTVDGDMISVSYNDNRVLAHYRLKAEKKQLRIPLSGNGTDVITIFAEEEGNEPPNTANLLLTDGSRQHAVIAYNNRGKQALIRIRRAPGK